MEIKYMLAPNGKPTNLTERQWIQVRTQNFKNWFGDWENDPANASKVIDENGEPLVVYHGTRALKEFNTFEGSEYFFSDNKTVADGFLAGYDYVLEINGDEYPISTHDMEIMADLIYGDYQSYEYFVGEYEAGNNSELSYIFTELSDITHNEYKAEVFNDFDFKIKKGGRIIEAFLNIRNPVEIDYKGATWQIGKVMPENDLQDNPQADGLIGYNIVEGGLTGKLRDGSDFPAATDYVVRNSNQIKSATDNVGTFDSANDDIRFSIKADTRTQEEIDELNAKFRDLYEQYKNGTIDVRQEALSSKDLLQDPDNYGDNEAFKQSLEIVSKLDLPRTAKTFDEAKEAIKDIIGKEITNKSDGFIATVSMSSVKKMLSKSAVSKSISPEAQAYAVANIDALFENSERLESKQDRAEDRNIKAIHRYYTPMYFNGEVCAVKITVKELVNSENNRIYSVESIDIKKTSEQSVEANLQADGQPQYPDAVKTFFDNIEKVNKNFNKNAQRRKDFAYQQAVELLKAEAERKGYAVKVYHGTGADGFNVADATSAYEKNGEGNQAHGAGLYMAVSIDTAKRYQSRAEKDTYYVIAGKKISEYGFDDLGLSKGYIYEIFTVAKSGGVEREIKEYESRLKLKKGFLEDLKESLPKQQKDPDFSMMMFNSAVQSYEFDINRYKKVIEGLEYLQNVLEENGLDESDIELVETEGHIFNWLTNLNDENTLDEQLPFSEQSKGVQEKLKNAVYALTDEQLGGLSKDDVWKDFAVANSNGGLIYDDFVNFIGSKLEASQYLLKHGIKGLTYDGRQDGRCYVSFEGGSAVKLQDPFTFDDNGELIPLTERFNIDNPDMRFSIKAVNTAIDEADIEIEKEHKLSAKQTETKIEEAKNKFVQDNINNYTTSDYKDYLEYYSNERGSGKAIMVYDGRYGGSIVEFIEDGKTIFSMFDNSENVNYLYDYNSLEDAKIAQLEDAWDEDFSEEDRWEYEDNIYEDEETNILQRKFVRAIEKLGIPIKEKQRARTGSEYVYIKTPSGDDMKIRIADHPVVYSADISIEQGDWKEAVRYVADVYNKWHEDYNDGETMRFSLGNVEQIASDNLDREFAEIGWNGITNEDMPSSIKSDPKGTIKRIKAKQIAKEVVENMSKNQENRKDSSPMFNDDYTQKLMGELRKELPVVMSDEDIEDIIDNAEVIAYKMWAKSKAKNQPIRFDEETANDYARHQIMDEIIRSEMREFAKNFKLEQREKELKKKAEASRLNKKLREQKGYSVKEIEADGIDIVRAFSEGEDSALKMVNKIVEKVSKANDDYDVYLANLIPTMSNVFEYAVEQLVYGRSRETALRRLLDLPKSNSVESLIKKSTKLAQRMSKYYEKQIADQLEEQPDKQVGKHIDRIKKYAKRQILKVTKEKLPDIRTPELKRKIPALLQLHYNMIQKAVKMPSNARDERMEYLRNRKSKLEEGGLDLNYREAEELAVLSKYAGLEDMTPAQLMDILADLKAIKNGAKDELFMKKAEWEESIEEMAKPLVKNLSQHKNKVNESEGLIKQTLKGLTMLKQRLEMLFAMNRSPEVDAWIDRTVSNISRASIRERNFIGKEQEWLNKTIKECYKSMFDNGFGLVNTEMQAVSRLCKPNPKFAKYSKTGDYNLSIGQLMMIVSGLEQTNVKMWYEQAKERLERLESKEELSDIDEVKLKNLREQIAPWEKAYNNYDAMKNELTSEDLDFLMEIKKRFTERADLINDPLVRHSGLPLLTVGLNYMPIVREGEYSIMVHGASKPELIPAVYSARTLSPLYFDETANVLGVFHSRTKTDAHFINFSDIQWEMSSLFANKEMGDAIKTRVKKETRNQLERVITDVLRGSTYVEETPNSKMAGKISTVGAFAGMAFNIISAVKQPTSFPAFALETGAGRYLKGWASLMGSGRTLEFMNDLWKSEELKFRRGEGINLILSYLASEERQAKGDQNSLLKIMRRLYSVWGFKPMQLADTFGFLGATGVYWERYLGYRATHDEQTAKKFAMEDLVAIGEMTQQSGLIHNLSEDQRKSGGFGRLFTLFRSTNQQWLSYEISAINDAKKNLKSVEAWKKVGRVMFLNHILLPFLFNGAGVLIDLLLGGALWDDEDERNEFIIQFFISGAMDVFCGWWFGSIMKGFVMRLAFGDRFDAPSLVVPASTTWERLFSAVFNACEELREGNWEGIWEEVNKMAKTVVPIYRTGERVYKRITDDEEGAIW